MGRWFAFAEDDEVKKQFDQLVFQFCRLFGWSYLFASYTHIISVAAFKHLAMEKGYSLVYCESHGVNCFFVHDSEIEPYLKNAPSTTTSAGAGGIDLDVKDVHRPPNYFGKGKHAVVYFDDPYAREWVWI